METTPIQIKEMWTTFTHNTESKCVCVFFQNAPIVGYHNELHINMWQRCILGEGTYTAGKGKTFLLTL